MTCNDSQEVSLGQVFRGDDLLLNLSLKRDDSPIDLTGSTLTFTIKQKSEDLTPLYQEIQTDINFIDTINGVTQFKVDGDLTATWDIRKHVFDIVLESPTDIHTTLVFGKFNIVLPVHID